MLYRKIERDIEKWLINKTNSALLISGVRQAGKTTSIRNVLTANKCHYVEFNFIEQKSLVDTLKANEGSDAKKILALLSAYTNEPLIQGETVIFFDEVQKYKEIVTVIKFLVDEGSFRYILSGSLLGIELNNLRSAPVGYMRELKMFPMDFEEFLYATTGVRNELVNILKDCFENKKAVEENIHKKMMEYYFNYLVVGGMPKAVQTYIDKNNYLEVSNIHKEIYPEYKRDFSQYEQDNKKLKLIDTYDLIPAELNSKNKRFVISDIDKKLKYNSSVDSFEWLIHAGVVIPTYNVSQPKLPLLINKQYNLFKLFLSDIGLLTTMYGNATRISLLNRDGKINCGAIFENYVAQELYTKSFPLYYFNSKKQGEIDFVIEKDDECLLIEVKSGKDYTRHSALNNALKNNDYNIEQAYVLCNENIDIKGEIIYLPIYMTMFI